MTNRDYLNKLPTFLYSIFVWAKVEQLKEGNLTEQDFKNWLDEEYLGENGEFNLKGDYNNG